jgi:hypothetical protein
MLGGETSRATPRPCLYETLRCDYNNIIIVYRSIVSSLSTQAISFSVGRKISTHQALTALAIVKRPESTLPAAVGHVPLSLLNVS